MRLAIGGFLLHLQLATAFAAALSIGPAAGEPRDTGGLRELGRAVYNFRCYYCHGYSGNAKTLAATFLTPPPADFTRNTKLTLPLDKIEATIRNGSAGTAMKPFVDVIPESEIHAVAFFVFDEFVMRKAPNTRYHTPGNGWPNHDRYAAAFPFATGELSLGVAPETLTPEQLAGRNLYLGSCVSCHDRGKPDGKLEWTSRPLSYPRHNYDHRMPEVDATSSATPYHLHDRAPVLAAPEAAVRRGEALFQANCAFCHAADGSGMNWIGRFLEPPARNLNDPAVMRSMTHSRLVHTIRNGLPGTSMPAWRDVLTDVQVNDLAAYVGAAFHPLAD